MELIVANDDGCPLCDSTTVHEHVFSGPLPPGDHPTYEELRADAKMLRRQADRMAAGITIAIAAKLLDARSPAGDALLDYLDEEFPWTREKAWDVLHNGR